MGFCGGRLVNYAVNSTFFTTSIPLMLLQAHLPRCARAPTQKSRLLEMWPCTKVSELRGVLLTLCAKKREKGTSFPSRSKRRFRISCQPFDTFTYPDLGSPRRAPNLVVTPSQEHNRVKRSSNLSGSGNIRTGEVFFFPSPLQLLDAAGAFSTRRYAARGKSHSNHSRPN